MANSKIVTVSIVDGKAQTNLSEEELATQLSQIRHNEDDIAILQSELPGKQDAIEDTFDIESGYVSSVGQIDGKVRVVHKSFPLASSSKNGFMRADDKSKLDGIPAAASQITDFYIDTIDADGVTVEIDYTDKDGSRNVLATIPNATTTSGGVMSAHDKSKVDNVPANTTSALAAKQDMLTAGTGIDITDDEISVDNTIARQNELNQLSSQVAEKIGDAPSDGKQYGRKNGAWTEIQSNSLIEVTYAELKALRDNSQLIPGQQYRITDYECTTTQEDTRAQFWRFDIIVTADDEKTLNENARAAYHEAIGCYDDWKTDWYLVGKQTITDSNGNSKESYIWEQWDEGNGIIRKMGSPYKDKSSLQYDTLLDYYFEGQWSFNDMSPEDFQMWDFDNDCLRKSHFEESNLKAWELKYCLNNDSHRFAWAKKKSDPTIRKAIVVQERENDWYVHARCPERDVDNKFAWAYVTGSDGQKTFADIDLEDYDPEDVGYTDTENIIAGETLFDYDGFISPIYAYNVTKDGKGVIYYMKDEWNNECPYDFKNIQFKRYYDEDAGYYKMGESENNEWCYTFCMLDRYDGLAHDVSVEQYKYLSDEGGYYTQYNNVIKPYYDIYSEGEGEDMRHTSQRLNNIVFVTNTDLCAVSDDYSYGEFYGYYSNTFGNDCYSNTFSSGCSYNIFGNNCKNNTFNADCIYNTFGDNCYANTLNNLCSSNTFGSGCYSNIFGNNCNSNTFGSVCYSNIFGNNCNYNTFDNYCSNNTFGSSASLTKDNYRYITYENGVQNTILNCTEITSGSLYCQNVHVNSGVKGSSNSNRKTLTVATTNNNFTTEFGMNSAGELKSWNPADLSI